MLLGKRIRELRLNKGYTQQKLGDIINVTKVSISCYENNVRTPNLDTFQDLVTALDTYPEYLLGMDINVIAEGKKETPIRLAKEDIDIIKQLKSYHSLYLKLIDDPKRTIELINKRMK